MMSHDSIVQWRQLTQNTYNNIQPPLHTFLMKAITLVWNSPAAVCLFQIIVMSLLVGYFLNQLDEWGVPKKYLWTASIITALSPINIILMISCFIGLGKFYKIF